MRKGRRVSLAIYFVPLFKCTRPKLAQATKAHACSGLTGFGAEEFSNLARFTLALGTLAIGAAAAIFGGGTPTAAFVFFAHDGDWLRFCLTAVWSCSSCVLCEL